MNFKTLWLGLAILGFVIPNFLVLQESVETGNVLLYGDPVTTFESMFANRISSIFAIDLLFAVMVFFVWSWQESKKLGIRNIWWLWGVTMLLGLAGALPLFIYIRARYLNSK